MALTDIDKKKLAFIRDTKKAEGAANATVNRHLAVISGILNKACKEWDWIDTVPAIKMLPEPSGRIRWITQEEAQRLISELPPHLEAMARFA
jgi:integrase